jgi:hypothetical protein
LSCRPPIRWPSLFRVSVTQAGPIKRTAAAFATDTGLDKGMGRGPPEATLSFVPLGFGSEEIAQLVKDGL